MAIRILPLLALLLLGGIIPGNAQQKNTTGLWPFRSINSVGLLKGQTGSVLQLETINGFQKKSWFGGIGVGLDYYRYRSIPLFASVRKEFGKKENKLFLYSNGGVNYYWKRNKDSKQFYFGDSFKKGFYGEAGFGYALKLNGAMKLLLSGGYSYKRLTEDGNYGSFNFYVYPLQGGPSQPQFPQGGPAKFVYNLNRLVAKVAIEF